MPSERAPDSIARRITYIRRAIDAIREYVAGIGREQFLQDRMRQDAIARQLLVIAEACDRITEIERSRDVPENETLAARYPQIPWRAIRGMGVRIRHGYDRIEAEILWTTATGPDLEALENAFRAT